MAADTPKPDARVIAAYLDDVDSELDAAERLVADPPNRFAAFHLQQAAEKLIKALRLSRGLYATAGHNIEVLANELPVTDPWRAKLQALEPLSAYATTYRYPTPGGKRKPGPGDSEVRAWIQKIRQLTTEARSVLSPS